MSEHFVTLFDKNFLPLGLALFKSLESCTGDFVLWVVCMDDVTFKKISALSKKNLRPIKLSDIEDARLLGVKPSRTSGEYCWTITPFTITAVFDKDAAVKRVTYVDADVFFFRDPKNLINEMVQARKHVLITDHAYDPRYDQTATSGRFCVQFMTFNRSSEALKVCRWWQDRCIEWCFNRFEDGKFGDQKYLDTWPEIFKDEVHILQNVDETLAPWNVAMRAKKDLLPVMYHFHGLRFMSEHLIRLNDGYDLGSQSSQIYSRYVDTIKDTVRVLGSKDLPRESKAVNFKQRLGRLYRKWVGLRHETNLN
jgi:hypothetical protein